MWSDCTLYYSQRHGAMNWWQLKTSRCSTFVTTTWHTFEELTKTLVLRILVRFAQPGGIRWYAHLSPCRYIIMEYKLSLLLSLCWCTHKNTYFPSQVYKFLRAHNNRFSCKIISGQYGCDEDLSFRLPERDTSSSDQTIQLRTTL